MKYNEMYFKKVEYFLFTKLLLKRGKWVEE